MGDFIVVGCISAGQPIVLLRLFNSLNTVQEHQIEVAAVQLADVGEFVDRSLYTTESVNELELLCRWQIVPLDHKACNFLP